MIASIRNTAVFCLIALVSLVSGWMATAQAGPNPKVRTDGLYYSKDGKQYLYLRFYDRYRAVIGVSTTESPEQVAQWFNQYKAEYKGKYYESSVYDITFDLRKVAEKDNEISYNGKFKKDELKTEWFHRYVQNKKLRRKSGSQTFAFVGLPLAKEPGEEEAELARKKEAQKWSSRNLLRSIKFGQLDFINQYLAQGADVNTKDEKDNTPLMMLLKGKSDPVGRMKALNILLSHGAEVNVTNDQGDTPLHYAAAWLDAAGIEALLKRGADVNAKNKGDFTPLHEAARSKNEVAAKILIEHGADVNAGSKEGYTPLLYAIESQKHVKEDPAILAILIERGANVNAKTKYKKSPLIMAAHYGKPLTVELLLKHGVDPNSDIYEGKNALMWADATHLDKDPLDSATVKELLTAAGAKPLEKKEKKLVVKQTKKPANTETGAMAKSQVQEIAPKIETELLQGECIIEETEFDAFDLYHQKALFNRNHQNIANLLVERNRYNPTQINRTYIDTLRWKDGKFEQIGGVSIDYEIGQPKNPMWICLDNEGNVITKDGKTIFVKPFHAQQGSEFKREGKRATRKIYPCRNCAQQTGIKNCVYVW